MAKMLGSDVQLMLNAPGQGGRVSNGALVNLQRSLFGLLRLKIDFPTKRCGIAPQDP